jgi:hypothetical protein
MKRALALCANHADKAGNTCDNGVHHGQFPPAKTGQSGFALITAHAVIASVTISSVDIAHLRAVSVRQTHYRLRVVASLVALRNTASGGSATS